MKHEVLIVADESSVITALQDKLKPCGYDIFTAEGGEKALLKLDELEDHEFPIIISDRNMKDMDGLSFLAEARKKRPNSLRVVVSGHKDFKKTAPAMMQRDVDRFLTEPWDEASLLQMVDSAFKFYGRLQGELEKGQDFENVPEGVLILNGDGQVESTNEDFDALTGFKGAELVGKPFQLIDETKVEAGITKALVDDLAHAGSWAGELVIKSSDGIAKPIFCSVTRIENEKNEPLFDVYTFIEAFEKSSSRASMRQDEPGSSDDMNEDESESHHDALTNLFKKERFARYLNDNLQSCAERHKIYVVFIDFNRFEYVNSVFGYRVGDNLLSSVAERIVDFAKQDELIGRIGGHKFALMLKDNNDNVTLDDYVASIQKIFDRPFEIDHHDIHLMPSLGVSVYPTHGREADDLMRHANTALSHAQAIGVNHYQLYDQSMRIDEKNKLFLENEIRRALKDDQFSLEFQPALGLEENRIVSAEGLIRWEHPEFGCILPNTFLPLCEETGLIYDVERSVIEMGCKYIKARYDNELPPIVISLNLSPHEFSKPGFTKMVGELMSLYKVPEQLLEFQLTETTLLEQIRDSEKVLYDLHELGVRLSLDNFGTGYASLGYLTHLPIDSVRVSHAFTQSMLTNKRSCTILFSILDLCKKLSIRTIVLGVEQREQLTVLETQACDEVQGYLIARPLSVELLNEFEWDGGRQKAAPPLDTAM